MEDKGKRIVTRIVKLSDLKEKTPVKPGKDIKPSGGAISTGTAPATR
jgi:hypothetical protein